VTARGSGLSFLVAWFQEKQRNDSDSVMYRMHH
jgi:hypothetical protein